MSANSFRQTLGIETKQRAGDLSTIRPLEVDSVHLWCLPLVLDQEQSKLAIDQLNKNQLDKYERRTPEAQAVYLAGRFYLRLLLSSYLKQKPEVVRIKYSRLGKPMVDNDSSSLRFNFSDTVINGQAFGIYAFSKERDVGVDIENLDRSNDFERIARRKFCLQEQNYVFGEANELNQRFLRIWTRKEAYGKAIGVGVNFTMNLENTHSQNNDHAFEDSKGETWRLRQFLFPERDLISCVVRQGGEQFKTHCFTELNTSKA